MTRLTTLVSCLIALTPLAACEQHHKLTLREPAEENIKCEPRPAETVFERPVDLLFVVDNSGSMREEQASLRAQIPRLIEAFSSGDLDGDGNPEHPAVADLHVGVITTDIGLPDVPNREEMSCGTESERFGDDGLLRRTPTLVITPECDPVRAPEGFLEWVPSGDEDADRASLTQLVLDTSCLATLGTDGCGYEQQLEATLKALWPSDDRVNGELIDPAPRFYQDADGNPSHGQGGPLGGNAGFLRNEPGNESVIVVVMLTDENDCSSHHMEHFYPTNFLPPSDPLHDVGLNLRCLNAPENQFPVSRYIDGLKALRPGHEDLVVFATVAGVPTDLIDHAIDRGDVDALDTYYDTMLADTRMQEVADPLTLDGLGNPNLIPACVRSMIDPATGVESSQRAFPGRRMIEVARAFGRNGLVESICQDDYTQIADHLLVRVFDELQRSSACTER